MSNEPTSDPMGVVGPMLGVSPESVRARVTAEQVQTNIEGFQARNIGYEGTDAPYIQRMEHFEGISHDEIYRNAQSMQPGNMHVHGDTFLSIASSLSGGLLGAHLAINKALSDGLEGQFANAAMAAAKRFYDQATDVHDVIFTVGHRVKAAAYGAEVVKSSIPPPPAQPTDTSTGATPPSVPAGTAALVDLLDPSNATSSSQLAEEQRQVAVGVMNTVYKPTYQPAGDGVPTFVPVQAPGEVEPGGVVPGSTGGGSTQSGGGSGSQGGTGSESAPGETSAEQPQVTAANADQSGLAGQGSSTSPTSGTQGSGTSSGADPRTSTSAAGFPGAGTGGSSGGSGRTGMPGGRSGAGSGGVGQGTPGAGRSLPGGPGTANPAMGGAAAAAAANSGRGMRAGMPGMMPPGGARRGNEEESERKTPDYLVGNYEEELLGRRAPAVPPTIGADAQSAQAHPPGSEGSQR